MDHYTGDDAPHGHDHGHDHDHAPGHAAADYFLSQLLTLFVCGGFGVVAILMQRFGMLNELLAKEFHPWVVVGGAVLLVFAAARGVAVWSEAGAAAHVHGPDCDHADGPHADHDHGGAFWRLIVLAFPLLLFLMGLPNEAFIREYKERRLGTVVTLGDVAEVRAKGGDIVSLTFDELSAATIDPGKRDSLEGRTISLKGQYRKAGEREFTLFKYKVNCCLADMISLKAQILPAFIPFELRPSEWVQVTGTVQFVDAKGRGQFLPLIRVKEENGIARTAPE